MKLVFHSKEKNRGSLRTYYHPSKDRFKKKFLIVALALTLVGVTFVVRGIYSFFRVRTVLCQSMQGECSEEDKKLTEPFLGRAIFGTFSLHSPGKTFQIKKKYPYTLSVQVEDIPILFVVFTDEQKQQRIAVSSDGVVYSDNLKLDSLSTSASAELIDLSLASNTQSISAEQLRVYETLSDFAKKNPIDRIVVKSREEIRLHTKPDLTAVVSSESIDKQLHSLQLILSSPTIEERPAVVDLRFEHPVLRYL